MHPRIALFAADLGGTLLGNPESSWRFIHAWKSIDARERPLLVYNSGRTITAVEALIAARHLPAPDHIIANLGTQFQSFLLPLSEDWALSMDSGWDIEVVEECLRRLPGEKRRRIDAPDPWRSSWCWSNATPEELRDLQERLRQADVAAQVSYSCRYFLDIIPGWAGKGPALQRLCRRLRIPPEQVLVAGDSAADASMFQIPGVNGIVVANALPELVASLPAQDLFHSGSPIADGVLEGLRHFGVISEIPALATLPDE